MKRIIFLGSMFIVASLNANPQQILKDNGYQISVPAGWTRTETVPQGMDVGFRKKLSEGLYATFYFHHEVMPPEAGEPPSDLSDMKSQWDAMVRNQYPGVLSVAGPEPKVGGKILVNGTYKLTDRGEKVQRRYTYFLAGRTAFVAQCSAPSAQWPDVLTDFDSILASLAPGGSPPITKTKSDDAAKTEITRNLPALLGSFPSGWSCSLGEVVITSPTTPANRTLEIKLLFVRSDIGDIYKATKLLFDMLKTGKTDDDLNALPAETKAAASWSSEFIKYIAQVWGYSGGSVASYCSPPIEQYKVSISDSKGIRIGSVSISREDASAILKGNVNEIDEKRLTGMYIFE